MTGSRNALPLSSRLVAATAVGIFCCVTYSLRLAVSAKFWSVAEAPWVVILTSCAIAAASLFSALVPFVCSVRFGLRVSVTYVFVLLLLLIAQLSFWPSAFVVWLQVPLVPYLLSAQQVNVFLVVWFAVLLALVGLTIRSSGPLRIGTV